MAESVPSITSPSCSTVSSLSPQVTGPSSSVTTPSVSVSPSLTSSTPPSKSIPRDLLRVCHFVRSRKCIGYSRRSPIVTTSRVGPYRLLALANICHSQLGLPHTTSCTGAHSVCAYIYTAKLALMGPAQCIQL